jgi:3-ketosteroid 9alpha-monooxygenase subunit A
MQLQTDGPFHKARAWYKQFYNKRERAAELQKHSDGVYSVRGMPAQPKAANG